MKSTLVRAAVVTLAVIGFGASTLSAKVAASTGRTATVVSMTPVPTCAPGGSYGVCGMH